ncbi:hypothetical protein BpHYR1_003306 [Brachionus plicatilis]|uniref:Uncharacterized protein n=1 Tax=Brachionus plicatilis TaxID=10195 RepID=A0A3M7SV26_BRAPC|nr:hypothetical protein BpHYR1_003306 [Brachionus plicatilis]
MLKLKNLVSRFFLWSELMLETCTTSLLVSKINHFRYQSNRRLPNSSEYRASKSNSWYRFTSKNERDFV